MTPRKHKFNATKTITDGINFASKKEAKRYVDLKIMKATGDVLFFLRQVGFDLPGGVRYFCDFVVFWENGDITFEDVKGMKTPIYTLKKKQVENLYPIEIKEI